MSRLKAAWRALVGKSTDILDPQGMTLTVGGVGTGVAIIFNFQDGRELMVILPKESAIGVIDAIVDSLQVEETRQ